MEYLNRLSYLGYQLKIQADTWSNAEDVREFDSYYSVTPWIPFVVFPVLIAFFLLLLKYVMNHMVDDRDRSRDTKKDPHF